MIKVRYALASAALLAALAAGHTAAAQYDFGAMWDGFAPVLLRGSVVGVEWVEPNAQVHMVDTATNQAWVVEGGSPSRTPAEARANLKAGDQIIVRGYLAKDKRCMPECRANGREVTYADGRKIFDTIAMQTCPGSGVVVVGGVARSTCPPRPPGR